MANNFGLNRAYLAKVFVPMLDEAYKRASLTSILDGAPELARVGANFNEMVVPTLTMDGLGTYSRDNGYVTGDVTFTNATYKCGYDRGRMFTVDAMDNQESVNLAFGRLAGEFIRQKVVPELDAYRFAQYASKTNVGGTSAALSTASGLIAALRVGLQTMDNAEVPFEDRVLFITGALHDLIDDQDLTKSNKVLSAFSQIIKVPQGRFYSEITMYDGSTEGQTGGGYIKNASTGKDLNFLIVHKPSVIQYQKHAVPKIVEPDANQSADAWKFGYRTVGIADVYAQKLAGVYYHKSTT